MKCKLCKLQVVKPFVLNHPYFNGLREKNDPNKCKPVLRGNNNFLSGILAAPNAQAQNYTKHNQKPLLKKPEPEKPNAIQGIDKARISRIFSKEKSGVGSQPPSILHIKI